MLVQFILTAGWLFFRYVLLWPFVLGPLWLWRFVWRQPLPLWRRASFVVVPWVFVGLLLAGATYADHARKQIAHVVGAEHFFYAKALAVESWFVRGIERSWASCP